MVKVINNDPKWPGIYKESTGERTEAESAYDYILSENPLNLVALFLSNFIHAKIEIGSPQKKNRLVKSIYFSRMQKRIFIFQKQTDGETNQAVDELNKFLQENFCDKEAWLELADIYLEKLK